MTSTFFALGQSGTQQVDSKLDERASLTWCTEITS